MDDIFLSVDKLTIQTVGHELEIKTNELRKDLLPPNMNFESSIAWRVYIKRTSDVPEILTIYCKLIEPKEGTAWSYNSGEHLDAIEIENETQHLHIGTEDGESMRYRAEKSDWFPIRLIDSVAFGKSLTEYIDFGFKTEIPVLTFGEKIYFQYLVATNSIKLSFDYPNERDCSTWYAVGQDKKQTEN